MPDSDLPLVSAVIPVFNSECFVPAAVRSVLDQDYPAIELIVVDDGSTDGSAAAARAAAGGDERFRLVSGKNGGEGASRNRGIRECAGKYIAFLDHDDVWLPDKTRKQVALLERDPEVVAVGCQAWLISSDGRRLGVQQQPETGRAARPQMRAGRLLPSQPSTWMCRASAVSEIGGFSELHFGADIDYISRLAAVGDIETVQEPLAEYRLHAASVSTGAYHDALVHAHFVQKKIEANALGEDLSLEDFLANPGLSRRQRRRARGLAAYRQAGILALDRRYGAAVRSLAVAVAAYPGNLPAWVGRRTRTMVTDRRARVDR